jgi:tetratricopeptide (TPR) repeat protein/CelD/BcsL family acetyltransferase involved in cellulose biosynthesis
LVADGYDPDVGVSAMHIEVIDSIQSFTELRRDWDAVYEADPEAQFFLSWTWLTKWLPALRGTWFILGAKPSADAASYVGFFPLRLRTRERKGGGFYNEINMAGNYGADYTGFICAPGFEEESIRAFARSIRQLNWTNLKLENVRASEERVRLFLGEFRAKKFVAQEFQRINQPENINNCICPAVPLPDDWETYLNNSLGAETRRTIRRFMKQIDNSGEFRITHADAATVERDIKILLDFWAARWGARKGGRLQAILRSNFTMLMRCFEAGSLFLPVMWKGEIPLGAQAKFIDPAKKSLLCFMGARDEKFTKPSPGIVLHAHSIRFAIANGLTRYDFMRGNEAYKYTFGVEEQRIRCIVVRTSNGENLGDKLDRRCLLEVLRRTTELHQAGRLAEAERGYRQILETDPQSVDALFRFGQLMTRRGKHVAAKRTYEALLALRPESQKVRMMLANSLEGLSRYANAADAYREVIRREPDFPTAHSKLGHVLFKLGRFDEAIGAFETALRLKPDYTEAEISWANILHMLGKLPPEKRPRYAMLNTAFGDKLRQKGALKFAAHCYRQAIKMQPDLVAAHYGLGLAFQAQNDHENAIASYRRALELEPGYRDVLPRLFELAPSPHGSGEMAHARLH